MALVSDLSDLSDLSDKLGRHGIPRGFACRSLVWLGRLFTAGQSTARGAPIKTQYSQHSQHSYQAPPVTALQTTAAMQNFAAKTYCRGMLVSFLTAAFIPLQQAYSLKIAEH